MDDPKGVSPGGDAPRRGALGQDIAAAFLRLSGYSILDSNRRGGGGEIDLVARRGVTLIFVEVRLRKEGSWVGASSSLGPAKRLRLRRCARALLRRRREWNWPGREIRFDVVALSVGTDALRLTHLRGVNLV